MIINGDFLKTRVQEQLMVLTIVNNGNLITQLQKIALLNLNLDGKNNE